MWESQFPPSGIERDLTMETRNPADFNQFLDFTPAYQQSANPLINASQQHAYYPDIQNLEVQRGRESLIAYPLSMPGYIRNQRFTK